MHNSPDEQPRYGGMDHHDELKGSKVDGIAWMTIPNNLLPIPYTPATPGKRSPPPGLPHLGIISEERKVGNMFYFESSDNISTRVENGLIRLAQVSTERSLPDPTSRNRIQVSALVVLTNIADSIKTLSPQ